MDEDGFIQVRARKKKRTPNLVCFNKCDSVTCKDSQEATKDICDSVDTKQFYEGIKQSEIEFFQSDFFQNFTKDVLQRHKLLLSYRDTKTNQIHYSSGNAISKIICLGLGNFTTSKQAQYQLIFLR